MYLGLYAICAVVGQGFFVCWHDFFVCCLLFFLLWLVVLFVEWFDFVFLFYWFASC